MKVVLENWIRLLFLVVAIHFFCLTQAQVSIGTLKDPQKGALLDLKEDEPDNPGNPNSEKGVLFPKVSLVSATSLKPLFTENATPADSLRMRGMIVYNVNENADGVDVGLSVWNGEEWMSVVGGGANKAAVFTVDWANVEVNGTYVKGKSLNAIANTITLPVTVTRTGSYNIVAYGQFGNTINGYSFSVSGEFMTKGSFTLTLTGMGAPEKSTNDNGSTKDNLQFFNHHVPYDMTAIAQSLSPKTLPSIFVEDVSPEYSYNCNLIDVSGASLRTGQASTGKYITVRITVPSDAEGAFYEIKTNTVDNVYFSASGTLVAGQSIITLMSNGGKPKDSGLHTFYLLSNSSVPNLPSCTFDVPVVGRKIVVRAFSNDGTDSWGLNNPSGIKALLGNTNLFGTSAKAYSLVEGINYTCNTSYPSEADFNAMDVFIVAFGQSINSRSSNEKNRLKNFLAGGGVVILCDEDDRLAPVLNSIVTGGFSVGNLSDGGTHPIYPSNSPIVKGAYMDLTGKRIGLDGGWNRYVNVPASQKSKIEVIVTSGGDVNRPIVFRFKEIPLIVFGDGSPLSGSSTEGLYNPVSTSGGFPAVKYTGTYNAGAYNAHLFVNIMVWAIDHRLKVKP